MYPVNIHDRAETKLNQIWEISLHLVREALQFASTFFCIIFILVKW